MAANLNSFAIRYCVRGRVEVLYPKTHLTREQTRVELGRIIDQGHKFGHKFEYIHVVPCVKRPGTKPVSVLSRTSMTAHQLAHACNYYHACKLAAC